MAITNPREVKSQGRKKLGSGKGKVKKKKMVVKVFIIMEKRMSERARLRTRVNGKKLREEVEEKSKVRRVSSGLKKPRKANETEFS